MEYIDYFKLQAKHLYKDFETAELEPDDSGFPIKFSPKYFKEIQYIAYWISATEKWLDISNISLMQAQHIIAKLAGFDKWGDLIKGSAEQLALGKEMLENQTVLDQNYDIIYAVAMGPEYQAWLEDFEAFEEALGIN